MGKPNSHIAVGGSSTTRLLQALAATLMVFITSCGSSDDQDVHHTLILAIDRTGVAEVDTWQAEVATQTQTILEAAVEDDVDQVQLIGLGSNTNQTATIATADLSAIKGNTQAKRDEARQRLVDDITSAATQVASTPVATNGTDIFAALHQAVALCQDPEVTECSVLLLSDLEDQRVTALSSSEAAVEELGHLVPDLTDISVQVSGLGASGADPTRVQLVRTAWEQLLAHASAVDVRIARSL